MWVYGLDLVGPGQRQVADACECDNEPWGSVKCGEFLDQLKTSQLLKKDFAPWTKYGVLQGDQIKAGGMNSTFSRRYKSFIRICNISDGEEVIAQETQVG